VIASPPRDANVLSNFLNLRVTDIRRYYDLWSSHGAKFITEPKIHATELRCYMRDPDGYLIKVGQTTMTSGPLELYVQLSRIRALPNWPPWSVRAPEHALDGMSGLHPFEELNTASATRATWSRALRSDLSRAIALIP